MNVATFLRKIVSVQARKMTELYVKEERLSKCIDLSYIALLGKFVFLQAGNMWFNEV